ncbi:MAG: type 4a pilus biogenesis protein PilO [bacterium]|nr:type 4a pilus biogenesis protein PilO [bacterium]
MFNILLPIIIAGASLGLFYMETSQILDRIVVVEATRASLAQAVKSNDQFQALLKEKNIIFNQIDETKKEQLKKMLPDSIDNVRLIIDINKIASDFGMTIRNISIRGGDQTSLGPDSRPFGVATLGFSVSGPYKTFLRFITALETSLRLIDVTSLSFTAGEKDQYEYNVEIKAYWLK